MNVSCIVDSVISSGGLHDPRNMTISSDAASPVRAFRNTNRTVNRAPFQPAARSICEKYESALANVSDNFANASIPSSAIASASYRLVPLCRDKGD